MRNSDSNLLSRWRQMKARCFNPKRKDYKYYGARGITMCQEWKNDYMLFRSWFISMAGSIEPKGMDVDRIDSDKGYSPDNCRVVSHRENMKTARIGRSKENGRFICLTA